jgi:hypothetical protein
VAAHGRERTLRDSVPANDDTASGDRDSLSAELVNHLRARRTPRRTFGPDWRYRPTDKKFVKRFVEIHNSTVAEPGDVENLRALGYIE